MFCSKCGFQLNEPSSFCPQCGERLEGDAPVSVRLSMDDFLAMSADYQGKKDEIEKKNTKMGILWFLGDMAFFALCLILSLVLLWWPLLLIGFIGSFILIIPIVGYMQKLKRELNDYGAQLYRDYLEKNNF